METAVGIFKDGAAADQAAVALRSRGFPPDRVSLLHPASSTADVSEVPTDETEQPGVGTALGGVVGGAAGASAGLGLGVAAASLLVPGVGAVSAIGLAAAALFGAGGAVAGAAAGHALEEKTSSGIPRDELYLYEDALAHGRSVVFALAETAEERETAERALAGAGAESLDAARHRWWVGLRDAEKAHYEKAGATFEPVEDCYRRGFTAALRPECRGKRFEDVHATLRRREGELADDEAYRRGFDRGRKYRPADRAVEEAGRRA